MPSVGRVEYPTWVHFQPTDSILVDLATPAAHWVRSIRAPSADSTMEASPTPIRRAAPRALPRLAAASTLEDFTAVVAATAERTDEPRQTPI